MRRPGTNPTALRAPAGPVLCVTVNRAPVLAHWAAVVTDRPGFDRAAALGRPDGLRARANSRRGQLE